MEKLFIRSAHESDLHDIYDFLCDLEEVNFDFEKFERIFISNLQNPDNHYLVALFGNELVGYISLHTQWLLHHCGKVGEIQELYVKKSHRSKGIGKQLVEAVEKTSRENDLVLLEVTANQKRHRTHAFYEKMGFEKTHFKFGKIMK